MNPLELDYQLKTLVPLWYQNITEYDTILGIEETQLQALAQSVSTGKADLFVQTMGEQSIQQWEQIFNIIPNPTTETLAFRQARLPVKRQRKKWFMPPRFIPACIPFRMQTWRRGWLLSLAPAIWWWKSTN